MKTLDTLSSAERQSILDDASSADYRAAITAHIWWDDLNEAGQRKVLTALWHKQIVRETLLRKEAQIDAAWARGLYAGIAEPMKLAAE